jgi:hypothetical protein
MAYPGAASVTFDDIGTLNYLIVVILKSHVTQEAVPVIHGSACCKPVHQYVLVVSCPLAASKTASLPFYCSSART